MFQSPKTGGTFAAPAEALDPNQQFLMRLVELTDEGPGKFAKSAADHRIRWTFELAYAATKAPIRDVDGNMYKFWDYTSSATTKSENKTATARKWLEALFGRDLEDSELPGTIAEQVIGKVARGMLEERGDTNDGEFVRLKILKLAPYVKGEKIAAVPPKPAAVATAADDSLPF